MDVTTLTSSDGNYKLVFQKNQGPFMSIRNDQTNSDTILVTVKGNQTLGIDNALLHDPQSAVLRKRKHCFGGLPA